MFEILKPCKSRMSVSWMELLSLVTGHGTFSKGKESYLSSEIARFSLFLLFNLESTAEKNKDTC